MSGLLALFIAWQSLPLVAMLKQYFSKFIEAPYGVPEGEPPSKVPPAPPTHTPPHALLPPSATHTPQHTH